MAQTKSYSELIKMEDFKRRLEYLMTNSKVGAETFGRDRRLNQLFYSSPEWKKTKRQIILRDNACDLGVNGYTINDHVYIHHINPITVEDIVNRSPCLFDPENLITTSFNTHQAIHFGDPNLVAIEYTERRPNDTCPWKAS